MTRLLLLLPMALAQSSMNLDWVHIHAMSSSLLTTTRLSGGMIKEYEKYKHTEEGSRFGLASLVDSSEYSKIVSFKAAQQDDQVINTNVTTTDTGVEGPDNSTMWTTNMMPAVESPTTVHNVSEDQWFTQLLSHFDNSTMGTTWKQRYWYNATAYKPGGPVILFDIGEVEGSPSWISYGTTVANALMDELGGIGIALEHRYYGNSIPTPNLSVDNLKWLNIKEAMADNAWLATNLVIPELGNDIRAPGTPWVVIGGSYPGAKAAITKMTYPNVFFGNIASAGVLEAKTDMWEYYDLIRKNLPPACSSLLVTFTDAVDRVLALNDTGLMNELYDTFGLTGVRTPLDFVTGLLQGPAEWQEAGAIGQYDGTWDPTNGKYGPTIDSLCGNITYPDFSATSSSTTTNSSLDTALLQIFSSPNPPVTKSFAEMNTTYMSGSVTSQMTSDLLASFKAYGNWTAAYVGQYICGGLDIGSCLDQDYSDLGGYISNDQSYYRSWSYQYCSEFGFFQTSAPTNEPSLISRMITVDSWQKQCNDLFPPGTTNALPTTPDTEKVTGYSHRMINDSRLAIVNGALDPWLPVSTTGVTGAAGFLINNAGHVFDFNYSPSASKEVVQLQKMLVPMVKGWFDSDLAQYKQDVAIPNTNPNKWHDPTHTQDSVWKASTDEEKLLFSQAFINPNPLIPGGVTPINDTHHDAAPTTTTSEVSKGAVSWDSTQGWVTNSVAMPVQSSASTSTSLSPSKGVTGTVSGVKSDGYSWAGSFWGGAGSSWEGGWGSVNSNTNANVNANAGVVQSNGDSAASSSVPAIGALADDGGSKQVSGALTDEERQQYYDERRAYYRRRSIIAGAVIGGILLITALALILYTKPWRRRYRNANGRDQIYRPLQVAGPGGAGLAAPRPSFGDGGMAHPSAPSYDNVPLLQRDDDSSSSAPAPAYAPPPGPPPSGPPPSYGYAPPTSGPSSSGVSREVDSHKEEDEYRPSVDEKRPLRDGEL